MSSLKPIIVSRLVTAVEHHTGELRGQWYRRMQTQTACRKALHECSDEDLMTAYILDSYDWWAILTDGSGIFGEVIDNIVLEAHKVYTTCVK